MRDARQMIDNIEFEQAFNEYRKPLLDVLPDELWPTGFELAYIFLHAGKTAILNRTRLNSYVLLIAAGQSPQTTRLPKISPPPRLTG
jgi:hypothetical protein